MNASRIWHRCEELARFSEQTDALTRIFLSPEQAQASACVAAWMSEAGMQVRSDALGNVIGRYEGSQPGSPCLLLGSHLDTVRNAGKYDGMLGVVVAIECVAELHARAQRLPFAIEVIGFSDEEGVRFGSTLLGSRAVAGNFDLAALDVRDRDGVSMRDAMLVAGLDPTKIGTAAYGAGEVLAYAELHIEQGPVLEAEGLALGVVTAINGFSRRRVTLRGRAGHAGTVPMGLRRDALAAAAECVLLIERVASAEPDLVGTVGRLETLPGAINVIPGEVRFTMDVRAPEDGQRLRAITAMDAGMRALCAARQIEFEVETLQQTPVARCAPWLMQQLEQAMRDHGCALRRLPSGAGHDGMAMVNLTDICMLFVRCKGGVSHHPDEAITEADAALSAQVLLRFIEQFNPALAGDGNAVKAGA